MREIIFFDPAQSNLIQPFFLHMDTLTNNIQTGTNIWRERDVVSLILYTNELESLKLNSLQE